MANCNNKCKHSHQDHTILYMMVFFILIGSCTDRTPQSSAAIRNIVSQQCVSDTELRREVSSLEKQLKALRLQGMETE